MWNAEFGIDEAVLIGRFSEGDIMQAFLHAALRRFALATLATLSIAGFAGCGEVPLVDGQVDQPDPPTLPSDVDDDPNDEPDDVVVEPSEPPITNQAPIANAGDDFTLFEGALVSLDGSGSSDPDGDELGYDWQLTSANATVVLNDSDQAVASFVAPAVDVDTTLIFTLTVSDGTLISTDEVEVLVLARIEAAGTGPIADAGEDQTVDGGVNVALDGRDSTGDAGKTLSYEWTQVEGPAVILSQVNSNQATFVAPTVTGNDATLVFELIVTQEGLLSADEVTILVRAVAAPPPAPAPAPPTTTPPTGTDNCPSDPNKTEPGVCGCGVPDADSDGDGAMNCVDGCPNDPAKTTAGVCGCGVADTDSDGDGTRNCQDGCPNDPAKISAGVCGCGVPDTDTDGDGTRNCIDGCPNDPAKIAAGVCGCGVSEANRDGDSAPDCVDGCPDDPTKTNAADCPNPALTRDTDWNLYMLRLVNRARRDPAGEAARIGSSVVDNSVAVQPLAYDLLVGTAAKNHNDWMHNNFGSIPSGRTPDTFSHYETLDGLSTGTPATSSIGFTGAGAGARLTNAGYAWGTYGENIQTNYASFDLPVHQARIDASHRGWWESAGHRSNMLYSSFTAFGFHIESRTFTPPRGGLNAPFDNLMFATQEFGRPQQAPRTYLLGLIYRDLDNNNVWTPRQVGDALREGLSGASFEVYTANTSTRITTGTTLGNGAITVRVADGVYDVVLVHPLFSGGQFMIQDVTVAGSNVDMGDFRLVP